MSSRRAGSLRRCAAAINRWDVATSSRIAQAEFPPALDRGLPLLTRAADRSVLWMAVSAALAATGNARLRRAAGRGLGSIAVSSLVANQLGKRAFPRRRPLLDAQPIQRIAHRVPSSSSFPSGHSASAAAFAVGAALECPPLALPLGLLAGAVGFSRVYTGVHFPSDVLAGAALGASIAGLGALVVPAHHEEPVRTWAEAAPRQSPRPSGRGVVALLNCDAGSAGDAILEQLRNALPDAELLVLTDDDDVVVEMKKAAQRAEVLGAAGGDGTINAAAAAAMDADLPLLVIPAGTFDHFAKDIEMTSVADAIDALRTGRTLRIDVGDANGAPFLNTASLGSYPEFVKIRERWQGRLGKPIAGVVAIVTVMRRCPPLDAEVDGVHRRLLLLFIGNGEYEPRGFVPRWRRRLDSGQLDVRLADANHGSTLGLVAATITTKLYQSHSYAAFTRPTVAVRISGERTGYLARDGEVTDAPHDVTFTVRRKALTVYRGPSSGG